MSAATYNKRDIERILKNNGWKIHHQSGGHIVYKNGRNEHLTITANGCNKMIMRRLIKQYDLRV